MSEHSDPHPTPGQLASEVGRPAPDENAAEEAAEQATGLKGEELKEVAGEPVDTGEGVVVPVQQTVGAENVAGGGEFPDPDSERGAVVQEEDR